MSFEKVVIDGPAGNLEGAFSHHGDAAVAVLCHPHPLYGGTMDDAVLSAFSTALEGAGISVLRFNFRGVGASDGEHDQGVGEVDDVIAACRWAGERGERLLLGGYSFGAAAALRAAEASGAGALLLAAPPPALLDGVSLPAVPAIAIYGDRDAFVDEAALRELLGDRTAYHPVAGADHFFMGFGSALEHAATDAARVLLGD